MQNNDQTKSNRLIFVSIVGIPIMVVLAATWLWYFVVRGDLDLVGILGTSNHGSLVQPPRLLDDGKLIDLNGEAFSYTDLPPQWTFLVPGTDRCESTCEELLYLTRQIHTAMGKEMHRIRRFYVANATVDATHFEVPMLSDKRPAPTDFTHYMKEEQPRLNVYTLAGDKLIELFPEFSNNPTSWYLVDPAGWIMMSYNNEVTYKQVISDLKFLLKNSSE